MQVAFARRLHHGILFSMQDKEMMSWLRQRGLTQSVLDQFSITPCEHDRLGDAIQIPVHDIRGQVSFNKYRCSPFTENEDLPKYLYAQGSKAQLYGWHEAKKHDVILVCEGEFDALIAWSNNIPAVSSTGGCVTWKDEWTELLRNKQVIIGYDNDKAGARGAAKLKQKIPHAAILFIPERPHIKDLTDYVMGGGNIQELLRTAKVFASEEDIRDDMAGRISVFESVKFHDEYLKLIAPPPVYKNHKPKDNSRVERAKAVSITTILPVTRANKALCPWHNEKTPSLHYYKKTNTVYCFACSGHGDAIDVYRAVHGCSFKVAINALAP